MAGSGSVFDREAMLAELGGDEDLLVELVDTMKSEAPKLLREVQLAVEAADPALVARAAHTLKGAISNFGAQAAAEAAFQLEQMGRAGQLSGVVSALATLEAEVDGLIRELERA